MQLDKKNKRPGQKWAARKEAGPSPRDREEVKRILQEAFRKSFPEDTVDVSDGYQDNIHVVVVSRRFDKLKDRQRQDLMWKIVDGAQLDDQDKQLISLLYPVSPAEIK